METLRTKIEADIKTAMINKETEKRDSLKFLKSEFVKIEKDTNSELGDAQIEKIIRKIIKNLETMNREEDKKEISILGEYLPKSLNDSEIKNLVRRIIKESPAEYRMYKEGNKGLMGFFMKEVLNLSGGAADPKMAGKIVKETLDSED